MGAMASQITSLAIVYSTFYSGADQRNNQSCGSLAFVRGIHRGPVNSPHKWPVTRKMFPFDDVIMIGNGWCMLWISHLRLTMYDLTPRTFSLVCVLACFSWNSNIHFIWLHYVEKLTYRCWWTISWTRFFSKSFQYFPSYLWDKTYWNN